MLGSLFFANYANFRVFFAVNCLCYRVFGYLCSVLTRSGGTSQDAFFRKDAIDVVILFRKLRNFSIQ